MGQCVLFDSLCLISIFYMSLSLRVLLKSDIYLSLLTIPLGLWIYPPLSVLYIEIKPAPKQLAT